MQIYVIRGSLGKIVGNKLGAEVIEIHREFFPDGEVLLKIPKKDVEKSVFIFQEAKGPESIIELLFCCQELRERGAKEIFLVLPYLPYMRQDKEFSAGEIVSARIFPKIVSKFCDCLITMNPHLHRIKDLSEVFEIETIKLSAGREIARFIENNFGKVDIVAPDDESTWIISGEVAHILGTRLIEFKKRRIDEENVELNYLRGKISERVVIVDDIASTGGTLAKCIEKLREMGSKKIVCVVVHCLSEKAIKRVFEEDSKLYSTNTIDSPASVIDVSDRFAKAIENLY